MNEPIRRGLRIGSFWSILIAALAFLIAAFSDLAGLPGPTAASAQETIHLVLEQGVGGYAGTRDNTIFEESTNTNGGGQTVFAGRTQGTLGALSRRALVAFDLSQIPAGSTIISASLQLTVSKTISGNTTQSLHRLTKDWGEGTADAPDPEGRGTAPAEGDTTWISNFHNVSTWDSPGGDFAAAPSASATVEGFGSTVTWSDSQLAADIQAWVDGTLGNFGWILIGDEGTIQNAKAFHSSESTLATEGQRPRLGVSFNEPEIPTLTPTMTSSATATPTTPLPTPTPTVPLPTPTPLIGDLNGDGIVDADDLYLFMGDWQRVREMQAE